MRWTRTDWIAIVAVTLLAAVLRFYQIGVVPPGFQFDEAFNAIDAQQVLAGNRPLFLPANAGREVVYTYWQALLVSLFGLNVGTLRLASAIFGVLAIPVTYILLRMMVRRDSRRVALFTSLVLATSLWHIHFSHYGIRVIMMPVVFSLAFGSFWLGHQTRRTSTQLLAYIAAGLFIGLSVWTHPTGRLAPFVVLFYTAWLLWQEPDARRLRITSPLGGLVVSGAVAFLVFLPLGLEFYRHPEFFTGHASEVSVFADRVGGDSPLATLASNAWRVLAMFAIAGDREWTHNLAGRPVFDILMAVTYFAGVAIWALRIARNRESEPSERADRNAFVLLAIWAFVMLLPSVLSEAAPNYSRTMPALPALFLAGGLGLTWIVTLRKPFRYAGATLAAAILIYSGSRSAYDYFVVFPAQQEVYYLYDADKLDALEYLSTLTGDNHVYLSQLWGTYHATVSMLRHELGIKSLDTSDTLVLPPQGMGAVYAFPSEQEERAQQLAELWPGIEVRPVPDRFDNVLLHLVEVPPGHGVRATVPLRRPAAHACGLHGRTRPRRPVRRHAGQADLPSLERRRADRRQPHLVPAPHRPGRTARRAGRQAVRQRQLPHRRLDPRRTGAGPLLPVHARPLRGRRPSARAGRLVCTRGGSRRKTSRRRARRDGVGGRAHSAHPVPRPGLSAAAVRTRPAHLRGAHLPRLRLRPRRQPARFPCDG